MAAQCPCCGRFARLVREWSEFNGNYTAVYATTDCKKCGLLDTDLV